MAKKNKKVSVAKKPFWVLSRRAVFGWAAVILFLCGWMFAIGVIVGRDNLPDAFDINPLRKELAPLAEKQPDAGAALSSKTPEDETGKPDLEFYEALPEGREDSDITAKPQVPQPKAEIEPRTRVEKKAPAPGKKTEPKPKRSMKRLTRVRPASKPMAGTPPKQTIESTSSGKPYAIQVAAFKRAADADKLVTQLKQKGFPAYRALGKVPGKGIWFRVRVGEFSDKTQAGKLMANLKKLGYKPALVER